MCTLIKPCYQLVLKDSHHHRFCYFYTYFFCLCQIFYLHPFFTTLNVNDHFNFFLSLLFLSFANNHKIQIEYKIGTKYTQLVVLNNRNKSVVTI